jgi:hypothetical protein
MRHLARPAGLGLIVVVLLTLAGDRQGAAAQAEVCLNSNVDYFLKIGDVVGESRAVSAEERCDRDATIAIRLRPATEQSMRPAETIIITVPQKPGAD